LEEVLSLDTDFIITYADAFFGLSLTSEKAAELASIIKSLRLAYGTADRRIESDDDPTQYTTRPSSLKYRQFNK
jgi:hypothetical protein